MEAKEVRGGIFPAHLAGFFLLLQKKRVGWGAHIILFFDLFYNIML